MGGGAVNGLTSPMDIASFFFAGTVVIGFAAGTCGCGGTCSVALYCLLACWGLVLGVTVLIPVKGGEEVLGLGGVTDRALERPWAVVKVGSTIVVGVVVLSILATEAPMTLLVRESGWMEDNFLFFLGNEADGLLLLMSALISFRMNAASRS